MLEELHRMNRADKLRVIQLLADDLATEEAVGFIPGVAYEIITPYGNEAAARVLSDFLATEDTEGLRLKPAPDSKPADAAESPRRQPEPYHPSHKRRRRPHPASDAVHPAAARNPQPKA